MGLSCQREAGQPWGRELAVQGNCKDLIIGIPRAPCSFGSIKLHALCLHPTGFQITSCWCKSVEVSSSLLIKQPLATEKQHLLLSDATVNIMYSIRNKSAFSPAGTTSSGRGADTGVFPQCSPPPSSKDHAAEGVTQESSALCSSIAKVKGSASGAKAGLKCRTGVRAILLHKGVAVMALPTPKAAVENCLSEWRAGGQRSAAYPSPLV